MKIAFLSSNNSYDIRHWSGSLYYLFGALCKHNQVTWLSGDLVNGGYWHHRFLGKDENFYPENYIQDFGRLQSKIINQGDFDAVVLRDYYLGTNLDINIPIAYISDATFNQFKEYLHLQNKVYEILAEQTEQALTNNVDLLLYSSEWTRLDALNHYSVDKSKIHVIEFGANIPHPEKYQAEIDTDFG